MLSHINFRCFSYATEDPEKVRKAFEFIAGPGGVEIRKEKGYHGNEIIIMEKEIKRKGEIRDFVKRLKSAGVLEDILSMLDELMDESGNIYLRFDKQEAYLERWKLAFKGDVVAVRIKVNAYPMRKESATENFKKFVEGV